VNEAMCAGVPIVVSKEVGYAADLVRDGVNGFTPRAGDVDGLVCVLGRLLQDEALRLRQGDASRERIAHWGFRQCLDGLRSALVGGVEKLKSEFRRSVAGHEIN
jgi:glycosyltransferase involved in cell wall biosynthesis